MTAGLCGDANFDRMSGCWNFLKQKALFAKHNSPFPENPQKIFKSPDEEELL